MPFASQQLITEATNALTSPGIVAKAQFLKDHPIAPPDGTAANHEISHKQNMNDNTVKVADHLFSKWKVTAAVDKIVFIRFKAAGGNEVGALTFEIKTAHELRTVAQRVGWIPIWWLPWKSTHVIKVHLNAPNDNFNPGGGIDPLPNPDVFFTAAINGCTVLARGDSRSPTVYHAGVEGSLTSKMDQGVYDALGGTSADVWLQLINGVYHDDAGNITVKPVHETKHGVYKTQRGDHGVVHASDYVKQIETKERLYGKTGPFKMSTTDAETFRKFLLSNRKKDININEVMPWGCVFGLRDSTGNWSFHLQKNVTVKYLKIVGKQKVGEARPDMVGVGATAPILPIQTVVNIGGAQFFPSPGHVAIRNFKNIQFW